METLPYTSALTVRKYAFSYLPIYTVEEQTIIFCFLAYFQKFCRYCTVLLTIVLDFDLDLILNRQIRKMARCLKVQLQLI